MHPHYLLGAIEPSYYESYKIRNRERALLSYKAMSEMMIKNQLVKIKEHPPYLGDMEGKVLLNSMARATLDTKTGEYSFRGKLPSKVPVDKANIKAVEEIFAANGLSETSPPLELISAVPSHNPTFVSRNFTNAEITYCRSQPSPPPSFAVRWAGKEAVFKSLGVKSKGASAAMKDIEIVNDDAGVPTVHLHSEAKGRAAEKGISKVLVLLSLSETVTIAIAQVSS